MSVSICAVDTCNTIIRWRILSRILREQPMRRIQKSRSIFENKIVSASATDYCWQCVIYNNRSAWSRKAFLRRMSMNYSHKPILTRVSNCIRFILSPELLQYLARVILCRCNQHRQYYNDSVQLRSDISQSLCATNIAVI